MSVYLNHIETIVPEYLYRQEEICDLMARLAQSEKEKRFINRIYKNSGIATRYSVLPDFSNNETQLFFKTDTKGQEVVAGTAERNNIFTRQSKKISVDISLKAIQKCNGISKKDVTHVITVTCTGFYNPGPDYYIINELGLNKGVQRYHLGFMGCYASIPAIRMAKQFCESDPDAVVLVVSLELCTLHMQVRGDLDDVLANSLFADGAAALLISSQNVGENPLEIGTFSSTILPDAVNEMAWNIGNTGFKILLSSYVAKIIGSNVETLMHETLKIDGLTLEDIALWAIHPGGRAIVDKVQESLELTDEQTASSRKVLHDFGNMSSATVLFVLKDLLENSKHRKGETICAMAFGPGLTVETANFSFVKGSISKRLEKRDPVRIEG